MNDLSEKVGLTAMICLLLLLILVSSFNIDNVNLNSTNYSLNNSNSSNSNIFINESILNESILNESILNESILNESILNESPLNDMFYDSATYSILIQDIHDNKTILDLNSEKEYSSLITKNLLLNLAVIDRYGPNNKLNLTVYTKGKIINGSLYGDMILVLEGNTTPLKLSSLNLDSELKNLSQKIKEYGINQIHGNIIIDMDGYNQTNNLNIFVAPSSNRKLANITLENNDTNLDIISNILTVNYTTNESISIITNNSTIILNGSIFNESEPISLEVPINKSANIRDAFINNLINTSISVNSGSIDYENIYEDILIKNNLVNGNISDLTVNKSKILVKNSTLLINISFTNNSSNKYEDYDKIVSLETKPLIQYIIPNLISFNKSNIDNNLYILDNSSNKTLDNGLKNLNEFLSKNNINSNYLTLSEYEKGLISPKLSNNILLYLYNQKYFYNIYENMSSINGTINIKMFNDTVFYENNNISMLNQSIIGYMDVNGSKLVFSIYLNNISVLNGTEDEKLKRDTISLLEKVYEKYNLKKV